MMDGDSSHVTDATQRVSDLCRWLINQPQSDGRKNTIVIAASPTGNVGPVADDTRITCGRAEKLVLGRIALTT
jgi:hypothetical protein